MPSEAVEQEEVKRQCVFLTPQFPFCPAIFQSPFTFTTTPFLGGLRKTIHNRNGDHKCSSADKLFLIRFEGSAKEAKPENEEYGVGGTA